MIRSTVRSAGLAILLSMNGCGSFTPSDPGTRMPGLNVAEAALQGGAGQIALQVSEGVLRGSPDNLQAMAIKGDALTLLGESDQATAVFHAILAKDPNSPRANIGLGRLKLGNDPAGADALFQMALRRDPKDLTALNNLGIARDLQGRHAEAQMVYRQALAINPELDSAQVNLALSLAMTGKAPEAIQLLKAKAAEPGAPEKIRHDYAVVLAMGGHRAEAAQVLGQSLPAAEVQRVLDNVTGTHTQVARDTSRELSRGRPPMDDPVPPDVVQVPEGQAPMSPVPVTRVAGRPTPPPNTAVAVQAAAVPMVIRPQQDSDAEMPLVQPVSPVAAAITNQRPLALPMRGADALPPTAALPPEPTPAAVVRPEVVAIPAARPVPRSMPIRVAAAETAAPAPAPLPRNFQPVHAEAPKLAPPEHPTLARAEPVQAVPVATIQLASVTAEPVRHSIAAAASATTRGEQASPVVQFAAAASEEFAHAFWQGLVHRFPEALSGRQPMVIRFERGGTVFWRVRTEGFGTLAEAQSLCARMRAGGQDCFVPRS